MENNKPVWEPYEEYWLRTKLMQFREFLLGLPLSIETFNKTPSPETIDLYLENLKNEYEKDFNKDGTFILNLNLKVNGK